MNARYSDDCCPLGGESRGVGVATLKAKEWARASRKLAKGSVIAREQEWDGRNVSSIHKPEGNIAAQRERSTLKTENGNTVLHKGKQRGSMSQTSNRTSGHSERLKASGPSTLLDRINGTVHIPEAGH
jgi:uncharacterized protein YdaT